MAEAFLDAKDDPAALKTFWNLWLGLAWEERGEAPEWQRLFGRREEYAERTIPLGRPGPDGILRCSEGRPVL